MSNRELFLARVHQAAIQGRQYRVALKPVPDGIGYLGAGGDLVERFAAEVNAVGGEAFVVSDLPAAREQLQKLLRETDAASAVCWQHELLARLQLNGLKMDKLKFDKSLASGGLRVLDYDSLTNMPAAEQREKVLACDVGITSCDYAIAETGTLVMWSRPGQERVASLLPPMHIAVVEQKQIVPDLMDAIELLQKRRVDDFPSNYFPSNVTFITGPSKTGDIELQLTTGVHGPGKWRVIVIA